MQEQFEQPHDAPHLQVVPHSQLFAVAAGAVTFVSIDIVYLWLVDEREFTLHRPRGLERNG